ncbi:uracil phosphoribosyltransferase [Sediminibacterium sp.]|uniref:uracil phosphoribosyltransferase n=1 Tax=Sediminibacterium sp. TaxID=1917865 RepID=UPI0027348590|nr:uracil phosphoribosyltransferase [Sediminibacterium sp.]MDP3392307.1 uracil phosphoribosyltransferase [Sediminibacterium sp.]MDP3566891.1 uracil phosphoribosyltransferase [Sediminibacterium sp.]
MKTRIFATQYELMVINLSEQHSLLSNWVSELRNVEIQGDRMRFRRNLERIAEVAAFEISKQLPWVTKEIPTPLGTHESKVLKEQPVLATILRAGLPMHTGMLNYFDKADNAFVSAYRKHHRDGSFEISMEYMSCPDLNDRVVIISDPMLATGASVVKTIQHMKAEGNPASFHVVVAIACSVGIEYLERECGNDITIWCGDIDEELTAKSYIVPGLGDAGDLAFGAKLQA